MKDMPKRALIVIGAALVLMVGGAIAYAAIPSASKVFTACVTKTTGAVRLIDAEATPPVNCKSSEYKTTWNQAGQPGAPGAPGGQGEQGDDGAAITADNLYTASEGSGNIIDGGGGWESRSYCDPGDKVIGLDAMVVNVLDGAIEVTTLKIIKTDNNEEGYYLSILSPGNPSGYATPRCLDLTP